MMLSGKKAEQTQEATQNMILLLGTVQNRQIYRDRKDISDLGLGAMEFGVDS